MPDGIARYCDNWIESYLEFTKHIPSPPIFRRWTAIGILCAAMERKVWLKTSTVLYPNMYILMVGPPGVGKTQAIRTVNDFCNELEGFHIAPNDVSAASLIDALHEAERKVLRPTEVPPFQQFNALTVAADELGVFMKAYDNVFMSKINTLFDNKRYDEKKRGAKLNLSIEKPVLNLIAGTTPGWLGGNLPLSAWNEGFTARLVIIYSGEKIKVNPFGSGEEQTTVLFEKLVQDLRMVYELHGQFRLEEDVVAAFLAWHKLDMPPIPEHPRLEHYTTRRYIHFLKLMMACSVGRSNELVIRMEDYQLAQNIMLEAEEFMPDVFKSMVMSADSNVIDECFAFVYNTWLREKNKPVAQHRIVNFIREKVPAHSVMKILETMINSRMIKVQEVAGDGNHKYAPIPRAEHGR